MNMKSNLQWDDLKYFLAMAEAGSLSGAARTLSVSQPTLGRRLTALEDALGAELFLRTAQGLELTELGEQLIESAKLMQDEAHTIERAATGRNQGLAGSVTITAIEGIGAEWLTHELADFQNSYPDITLEIKIDNSVSDLLRREADIAIRMFRPTQVDLIARKSVTMKYGLFASKNYIDEHGIPESIADLVNHRSVLPHDELMQLVRRRLDHLKLAFGPTAFRSNSMFALIQAVRSGYGIGTNSLLTASLHDDIERVLPEVTIFSNDLWLVTHPELRRSARIRVVWDFLVECLQKNRHRFEGA